MAAPYPCYSKIFGFVDLLDPELAKIWVKEYTTQETGLKKAIDELSFAIDVGYTGRAELLVSTNYPPLVNDKSPKHTGGFVYMAVVKRRPEILELLLKAGAKTDEYCQWMHHYETPLNLAARSSNVAAVRLLLASGANPDLGHITTGRHTPLLETAFENSKNPHAQYLKIAQLLVDSDADRTATTNTGSTATDLANPLNKENGMEKQMQKIITAKYKIA